MIFKYIEVVKRLLRHFVPYFPNYRIVCTFNKISFGYPDFVFGRIRTEKLPNITVVAVVNPIIDTACMSDNPVEQVGLQIQILE